MTISSIKKTFSYKIWKHYTKKLFKNSDVRADIFSYVSKLTSHDDIQDLHDPVISFPTQIITGRGFYASGGSTVAGLFSELDNVTALGFPESIKKKKIKRQGNSEAQFFNFSHFFDMVDSFSRHSLEEQDMYIKYYIHSIQKAYKQKGVEYEYLPELYTDLFQEISLKLLFNIVDLDQYTYSFMKQKKQFPVSFESWTDTTYEDCCFMHGKGIQQYIFYKFKKLSKTEFDSYIAEFLRGFFNIINKTPVVFFDGLLAENYLEKIQTYLPDIPIKQVCVWRDPRDQFLSSIKTDMFLMPRELNEFVNFYKTNKMFIFDFKHGLEWCLKNPNPNRLMVRFEDLILKYDETVKKIFEFAGVDSSHHVHPKTFFVPELSVANIGIYKNFVDQEFMKQVEQRLGEYCYYPEKENLSEEAWNLLKSNGNWEKKDA